MITPRNRLLPATFAAFLLLPCPSVLARSAFVPTYYRLPAMPWIRSSGFPSGSSAYSPAYPSFCYFPPFCFTPLFSGTKKVHTLSYKLDLRSQATHFFMVNIIFLQNKNEQQVNWIYAYLLLVCCNYISCFSKCQTEFYCPLFVM